LTKGQNQPRKTRIEIGLKPQKYLFGKNARDPESANLLALRLDFQFELLAAKKKNLNFDEMRSDFIEHKHEGKSIVVLFNDFGSQSQLRSKLLPFGLNFCEMRFQNSLSSYKVSLWKNRRRQQVLR